MRYLAVAAIAAMMLVPMAQAEPSSGEEVIAKYIEAIGGEAALGKIKTRKVEGTFNLPAMGMEATYEMIIAPPNSRNLISLPSFGDVIRGKKGDVAYSFSPMEGAKVLDGGEKAAMVRQSSLDEFTNWKEYFKSAELKGTEEVDGKAQHVVTMTPKEGEAADLYFDAESGLLTQMVAEAGGFTMTTKMEDYKEVDGIMIAHKISNTGGQLEFEITTDSVVHNEEYPEETFAVPAEVKPLLGSE